MQTERATYCANERTLEDLSHCESETFSVAVSGDSLCYEDSNGVSHLVDIPDSKIAILRTPFMDIWPGD